MFGREGTLDPVGQDEIRLAALVDYAILDTSPEQGFDDLTLLASQICDVPVALISFVDWNRQWFKANIGFPRCETDLNSSVCRFVLDEPDILTIPDLTLDPRTSANPLVTDDPCIRFYAGAPLRTPAGVTIGSLCVIDNKPRPSGLTEKQREALSSLARQVITLLELRRESAAHRTAALALRESEVYARENVERVQNALAAGAIIGTWHWDLTTDRFTVDDAFARSFGLDPALGREGIPLAQIVATVHPDDQAGLAEAIDEVIARGGRYAHQYRTKRADGKYYWLEANGHVTHAPDGTPLTFPGVLIDLEERRAVEAERDRATAALRALTETLEQRVTERSAELLRAEEQLRQSQKMEAVGQLTGGVAHDFNNLLTIIRSSVDFLRRPDLPEDRRKRYMDAVSDTVDRAAKLTSQLLAFARRQALKPEVLNAADRLRAVADMLDTVTGARVQVVTELTETHSFIRVDQSQFETALVNMAVNARDAMAGEGTLTMRLRSGVPMPPIRGHAGGPGPFAVIDLTDTGTGIAEEDLARIFEPFFTTKEIGKGTGLGLSQVFGFAKQSGGDVDVRSVLGQGTTFSLYLPEVEALPDEAASDQEDGPGPDGTGVRVLVVEDNIEVGKFATQILEDLGYRTEWVSNAEHALDRLGPDGDGFDAVFSDVVMPGMGGIALAEELRQRLPMLPVVLASGYSHVLAQNDEHGFELLNKPYSADQLSYVLHRVTNGQARKAR